TEEGRKKYADSWFAHAGEANPQQTLIDPDDGRIFCWSISETGEHKLDPHSCMDSPRRDFNDYHNPSSRHRLNHNHA
ncbi:MAG: hypothetical protein DWI22_21205, partial [Planctomycetota bacterium]